MKKANTVMDFTNDRVQMLGQDVDLKVTKSGHYCIDLIRQDAGDITLINFEDKTSNEITNLLMETMRKSSSW